MADGDMPRARFHSMCDGTKEDWDCISSAMKPFIVELPDRVLAHLKMLQGDCGGFAIDRLDHCLQTATRAHRDGRDEEYVVCALLHDMGDILGPRNHADVAAAILKPFVSEQNHWMVEKHAIFQGYYFFHHLGLDRNMREQFRDHPWYARTPRSSAACTTARRSSSLTISSAPRTCTSGSPRCGRSSRTSRARNVNTRFARARRHSAGATIRSSSSTTIRASRAHRRPGAKAFSAWSPMSGMGRAGIVMGLEVSRLARNNADWHRLLEICALADTLILDEDGVYDPANFNDRLLLGLKGTMSEAELHVLKARLRGGILNKVRRGEYRCALPTGLVYDEAGNVVLDPDAQVRETIAYFFETFSRVGSASQTVKVFRDEGLVFRLASAHGEATSSSGR